MTDTDNMCSNPECVTGSAEAYCAECGQSYCHGHARHPDHTRPAD
ncbi:MAG: hypothetical protein QOD92_3659 [Acidimicrobiaceae bacterium]|jgi:hypothetical protein